MRFLRVCLKIGYPQIWFILRFSMFRCSFDGYTTFSDTPEALFKPFKPAGDVCCNQIKEKDGLWDDWSAFHMDPASIASLSILLSVYFADSLVIVLVYNKTRNQFCYCEFHLLCQNLSKKTQDRSGDITWTADDIAGLSANRIRGYHQEIMFTWSSVGLGISMATNQHKHWG